MNIVRWRPMREMMSLRSEFDRLFEEAFNLQRSGWQDSSNWGLELDVSENEDSYMITAPVPGVKPEDLDITLTNNVLTIRGETTAEETQEREQYYLRERRYGTFSRSITLPTSVNADQVEASCENGILKLQIPKIEEVKPKRISVTSGSGQPTGDGQNVNVSRE